MATGLGGYNDRSADEIHPSKPDPHGTEDPTFDEPDERPTYAGPTAPPPDGEAETDEPTDHDEWLKIQLDASWLGEVEDFEPWTRRQIIELRDDVQGLLDDPGHTLGELPAISADMRLTEDRIVDHAAAQGWPVAACGEPCRFVAAAPTADEVAQLLDTHVCAHADPEVPPPPAPPAPRLGRLVVGCLIALGVLVAIAAVILDLAGVK